MPSLRKKILYITEMHPFIQESGGSNKTRHTLEILSSHYDIDVVCLTGSSKETSQQKHISTHITLTAFYHAIVSGDFPQHKFLAPLAFLQGIPFYIYKFYSAELDRYLQSLDLSHYASIHIDHVSMIQYLPRKTQQPLVYEEHNIEHKLYKTLAQQESSWKWKLPLTIESWLLRIYEKKNLSKFDLMLCISQEDEKYLQRFLAEACPPTLVAPLPFHVQASPKLATRLLFLGSPDWKPNLQAIQWLSTEVLPKLRKKHSGIELHVTGDICSSRSAHIARLQHVQFHGYIKNLSKFLEAGGISLLPFFSGAGVRMKALTSTEYGLPIIATPLGIQGLPLQPQKEYLEANTAHEFLDAIESLLRNPKSATKIAASAQKTLTLWTQGNEEKLLQTYTKLLNNFHNTR